MEFGHVRLQDNPVVFGFQYLLDLGPEHPRPPAGVMKGVDQGFNRVSLGGEQRIFDRSGEGQPFNALGGPLRFDLGAGDAPDLLRVRLEEDLVEPLPEAVRDPLLEVLLFSALPRVTCFS